jgi:hypothetical protein
MSNARTGILRFAFSPVYVPARAVDRRELDTRRSDDTSLRRILPLRPTFAAPISRPGERRVLALAISRQPRNNRDVL